MTQMGLNRGGHRCQMGVSTCVVASRIFMSLKILLESNEREFVQFRNLLDVDALDNRVI